MQNVKESTSAKGFKNLDSFGWCTQKTEKSEKIHFFLIFLIAGQKKQFSQIKHMDINRTLFWRFFETQFAKIQRYRLGARHRDCEFY